MKNLENTAVKKRPSAKLVMKTIALVSGIACVAGVLICLLSYSGAVGTRVYISTADGFIVTRPQDVIPKQNTYDITKTVNNIEIKSKYAGLKIVEGDSFRVTTSCLTTQDQEDEFYVSDENGTLTITIGSTPKYISQFFIPDFRSGGSEFDDGQSVEVTIPKGMSFDNVSLTSYSDMDIQSDFKAENLTINADYGSLSLSGVQVGKLSIDSNSQHVVMSDCKMDTFILNAHYSKVEIDGTSHTSSEIRLKLENSPLVLTGFKSENTRIDASYGEVTIDSCELGHGIIDCESDKLNFSDTVMDSAEIDSKYGSITATNTEIGYLEVKGESSNIDLSGIFPDCNIKNQYANVTLNLDDTGSLYGTDLDLYAEYGDIEVNGANCGTNYNSHSSNSTWKAVVNVENGSIKINTKRN